MPNYLTFMIIGFPETILVLALGLALSGRSFRNGWVIPAGFVGSTLVYFIRSSPLPYGLHILLIIIFYIAVLTFLFKVKTVVAIRSALIAYSILAISEIVSIEVLFSLTGKTFEEVTSRPLLWALFGLPYLAVMAGATALVHYYTLRKNAPGPGYRR
ncbi:MAG: hypothetical protein QHH02_00605 [Syntrophomonadaceae bacterium]|nr:hypothetical protein [Syntrophomonadaceae bacterium]